MGIQAVMKYLDIKHAIIAVERDKLRAKAVLAGLLRNTGRWAEIEVKSCRRGTRRGRKVLSLLHRQAVLPGTAADIGCIVLNVASFHLFKIP